MFKLDYSEYKPGRYIIARAEHDADLVEFIKDIVKKEKIEVGVFTAIGALKKARLGFYNQETHKYQEISIDGPCEIASCIGNISSINGEKFVHSHVVLTEENGSTKGGHLSESIVFAGEIHIQELKGPKLERKPDDITELTLWEF